MKKASLLLLLMLAVFIPSNAQETIELTFTANTQGGMYCPFDAVNVTNVTRGWTETLAYPDTVLVLNSTVGIGEQQYEEAIHLGEAYPNPFTEETNAPLDMPFTGEVSIQVVRIDGTVVATSRNHLEAGSYRVKVSLSSPAMAFLVVTSTQGRQVVRVLCTKSGGRDSITLEPVSREYKPSIQLVHGSKSGEFQPGDMMRYTSVLFDGANTVYSNTITQQQYESEIVTLLFDLTLPDVTTSQVTNITQTSATGGGNVTATGGVSVTERGICWSTSHNPTISSSHASNGLGAGSYTVQMSGLTTGTTYFVRAYAINKFGTAYGNEVNFTTTQIPSYTINVSANPTNGGTVSGGGSYQQGQSCTVIATAANGYSFNNWTENGSVVSTNPNYSFTVSNNRSLVANFSVQAPSTYTINASPNPSNGGLVTGGGTYQQGQSCTVSAVANTGYTFLRWTENGNQVSTNANYTFTVTGNRTLVAQFQLQSFTISATVTPSNSGTVTGGGSYNYGQICTLTATANTGYVFEKWTKNGTQISTEATYSFTVTESASYVAHFQLQNYTINVSANPSNGGSVSGGGSYSYGQSCTLTATANTGYSFIRWTENGNQVSTNANYTFTVTDNRFLVAQFQEQSYTITASANPTSGGSVTGGGSYNYGQSCTLSATAAPGYTFLQWTENGNQVSTNASYTFTVTGNRTLVAQFQEQSYIISVSASPTFGGSVSGGGSYNYGQSCTVTATVNNSYSFNNWTENGNQVSSNSSYTFTVSSNRSLVANFTYNGSGNTPTGAINGLFSVSADMQVYFSQGNLQYNASSNTWQFAASQYEIIGSDNSNVSQTYSGWIDLFGWGTSGWDCGNTYYHPWDSYYPSGNLYGPPGQYNLTGSYINSDWGYYNAISNGGNQTHQWRTLTNEEWEYVFYTRTTTSGIRYVMAKVNNVNGVILLPDNWNSSTYYLSYANQPGANFSSNPIDSYHWSIIESAGAVFLPAAGARYGASVYDVGSFGLYWSSSYYGDYNARSVNFHDSNFGAGGNGDRCCGLSVRLVQDNSGLPTVPTVTTAQVTNIQQTTAIGGGNVTNSGGSTVSERGICWSTSHNPTTSGSHASSGTGTGAFSINMTGLTAGTTYYVRAYAINNQGTAYGSEVSFTTLPTYCTITVSSNPTTGGSVTGGGAYQQGQPCTVSATANTGYIFNNWTENGSVVSNYANYTFTVTGNRTLEAHFQSNASAPTVTTTQVTNIQQTTAIGGGNVTATGGANVTERGICWSTSHNPTTSGSHSSNGTGTGLFTVNMTGLTANTTYYVRAYATNSAGTAYGDEVSFTTLNDGGNQYYVDLGLPSGLLWATRNVGANAPEDYGDYFAWGETSSKSTYNWNTYYYCNGSNTTLTKYCDIAYYGNNGFTDDLTVLQPGDDAATINWWGDWRMPTKEEWQELYQNTTVTQITQNGVNGRLFTASNGNTLFLPAAGYRSQNVLYDVSSCGYYWSSSLYTGYPDASWIFRFMSGNYYVDNRTRQCGLSVRAVRSEQPGINYYSVTVSSSPVSGGTVTGGGVYQQGQLCSISAVANSGYTFVNWTENGNPVSTNTNYTFTVNSNRTLVACFSIKQLPTGAINGLFSVSATKQVWFSQGNLQYNASQGSHQCADGTTKQGTWRFAINQWDYVGGYDIEGNHFGNVYLSSNNNIGQNYSGWIDLFGWGTSGWHYSGDPYNVNYYPWSTSTAIVSEDFNKYGYGPSTNMASPNLTGNSANYDWGVYNAISNGEGSWRTLTSEEWSYVINTRSASTVNGTPNARFANAIVNDVKGVILFPDNYLHPSDIAQPVNINMQVGYYNNNYSADDFALMQVAGAVFLPAAGSRSEKRFSMVSAGHYHGYYWSTTYYNGAPFYATARYLLFSDGIYVYIGGSRYVGMSIRLVQDY